MDVVALQAAKADAKKNYAPARRRKDLAIMGNPKSATKRVIDGRLGDAVDGDLIINSPLTITTDKFYGDVRIGSAATLTVARGVTVCVAGETSNNGIIQFQTTDASNATGSSGGLGGGAPTLGAGSTQLIGAAGGNTGGNGTTTNGATGVASAAKTTPGGTGGAGGVGGASGANTGGASGGVGAKTSPMAGLRSLEGARLAWLTSGLATGVAGGSGGGGAGDGTNAGGGGGGGGAAGGMGLWLTNQLVGSGLFLASGGKGGNGAAGTGGNAAGGAGGGGGGGGICIVACLNSTGWTGTVGAPGGAGGTGGAGVGTGAAGANGTAGGSGTALLLSLNALKTAEMLDIVPKLVFGTENAGTLQSTSLTLGSMPVRFRGGPAIQYTTGGQTYLMNGLYAPNSGFAGKNNGGAPWIMDYYTDADVHSVGMFAGNGKYRLKVDGEWVNDFSTVPYSGTGGIIWLQVSFSKRRQMRHYEWYLSSVPVRGIGIEPTSTIYTATEPLDIPRAFIGDSFTEGASGNTNSLTWEMGSWAYRLAHKMGWDNIIVDAQGGTGYTNDGGFSNGKKVYPQRVTDDFGPLKGTYMEPKHFIVAGGFNDGDATTLNAAAATTFANIATVAPNAVVDVIYFTNTGSPAAGYLSGRTKIKNAALAAPNVRCFIDAIDGTVTPGPAAKVSINSFVATQFLTGSGYQGATNGTGNSDFLVATDAIHPSYPEGHEYLALRTMAGIVLAQQQA